jgi:hypothetical protein
MKPGNSQPSEFALPIYFPMAEREPEPASLLGRGNSTAIIK